MAVEAYQDDGGADGGLFGLGEPNTAYARYFVGNSYLRPLTDPEETIFLANVTFEPGCRNHWHIHHAETGGGQTLKQSAVSRETADCLRIGALPRPALHRFYMTLITDFTSACYNGRVKNNVEGF